MISKTIVLLMIPLSESKNDSSGIWDKLNNKLSETMKIIKINNENLNFANTGNSVLYSYLFYCVSEIYRSAHNKGKNEEIQARPRNT